MEANARVTRRKNLETELIVIDSDTEDDTHSGGAGGDQPPSDTDTLLIYPSADVTGAIKITKADYQRLSKKEYLNDSLIEFYLKYLAEEVIDCDKKDHFYFFPTFFFEKLRLAAKTSEKTVLKKRFASVKRWTKNVNIFTKEFVFIPINDPEYFEEDEANDVPHWYVAVVCFPNLDKPSTTNLFAPIKQPCILIFDSLYSSRVPEQKLQLYQILWDYLSFEYYERYEKVKVFTRENMKVHYPRVIEQSNDYDCGIYLLQYVEQFIKNPITDFRLPMQLKRWFSPRELYHKRYNISQLIIRLIKRQNASSDVDKLIATLPKLIFSKVKTHEEDTNNKTDAELTHVDVLRTRINSRLSALTKKASPNDASTKPKPPIKATEIQVESAPGPEQLGQGQTQVQASHATSMTSSDNTHAHTQKKSSETFNTNFKPIRCFGSSPRKLRLDVDTLNTRIPTIASATMPRGNNRECSTLSHTNGTVCPSDNSKKSNKTLKTSENSDNSRLSAGGYSDMSETIKLDVNEKFKQFEKGKLFDRVNANKEKLLAKKVVNASPSPRLSSSHNQQNLEKPATITSKLACPTKPNILKTLVEYDVTSDSDSDADSNTPNESNEAKIVTNASKPNSDGTRSLISASNRTKKTKKKRHSKLEDFTFTISSTSSTPKVSKPVTSLLAPYLTSKVTKQAKMPEKISPMFNEQKFNSKKQKINKLVVINESNRDSVGNVVNLDNDEQVPKTPPPNRDDGKRSACKRTFSPIPVKLSPTIEQSKFKKKKSKKTKLAKVDEENDDEFIVVKTSLSSNHTPIDVTDVTDVSQASNRAGAQSCKHLVTSMPEGLSPNVTKTASAIRGEGKRSACKRILTLIPRQSSPTIEQSKFKKKKSKKTKLAKVDEENDDEVIVVKTSLSSNPTPTDVTDVADVSQASNRAGAQSCKHLVTTTPEELSPNFNAKKFKKNKKAGQLIDKCDLTFGAGKWANSGEQDPVRGSTECSDPTNTNARKVKINRYLLAELTCIN